MDNDVVVIFVVVVGFNEVWSTLGLLYQGYHIVLKSRHPWRCRRVQVSSGVRERHPRSRGRGGLWFDEGGIEDGGELSDSDELGVTKLGEWCCRDGINK